MTFSFLVAHVHSHTLQYYYTHAGMNFSQAVRNHVPAPRWKEQYEDGEVVIRTYSFKTEISGVVRGPRPTCLSDKSVLILSTSFARTHWRACAECSTG